MPTPLPIDEVLPQIVAALRTSKAVVLRAPTGAGKTTRVPPALLDAGLAGSGAIVVLQPRRLTARACARRIAFERGTALGGEVGYHVRFDRCMGPQTRIRIVTEGIFLRMLQDDPYLESVAAVVFDEFHERSLNSDLALAMLRRVRETVRPELKIVVMSATLAAEPIARWLGDCPVVESRGRLHPVEIRYLEERGTRYTGSGRTVADRAADAVEQILDHTPGDVLVFLPGVGEIRQTARRLESLAAARNLAVLPLYGDLPAEKQDEVLGRGTGAPSTLGHSGSDRRKVVLSTNVAETSLTIEGITAVVDTGLARSLNFDPHVGMDRLQLTPISQASADQRAGRAGRTQPGVCLRLWAERTHRLRPAGDEPEIHRLDMAGPLLELRVWGETDLQAFPWFEAPPLASLEQADALLKRLGALDGAGNVTPLGAAMARLPVSPRLARMLLEGDRLGQPEAVALAAALLGERDPFGRGDDARGTGLQSVAAADSDSDVYDRVAALEDFAQSGRTDSPWGRIHRSTAQFVLHVRDQLLRELRQATRKAKPSPASSKPDAQARNVCDRPWNANSSLARRASMTGSFSEPAEAVRRGLLAAFPDRLVRRSGPGSRFGRMVGGRGVRVVDSSAVRNAPLFLAVDVDRGGSEALVRQASAIERDWLPADRLVLRTEVEFDAASGRVIARRRVYWEDLLLEETPAPLPDGDEVAAILAAAAAQTLDEVFPWNDTETADYVNRVRCLAQWMPELELPPFDAAGLQAILPQVCHGCRSLDELRKAPWLAHLRAALTQEQQRALSREVPERIEVPSGSRIKLHYEAGKPPVLAVRIQEIFGMLETPRVAGRRVAVLLHLLAPNGRPQQVTDDLASFWRTTYHQVRKDLRRRYPKHAWPEDPYQAKAEKRPGKKGAS